MINTGKDGARGTEGPHGAEMVKPIEIALAAHQECGNLIRMKLSPQHDESIHLWAGEIYANAINRAGLEATAQEIVDAIINVKLWDRKSAWTGHPDPMLVVEYLSEGRHNESQD